MSWVQGLKSLYHASPVPGAGGQPAQGRQPPRAISELVMSRPRIRTEHQQSLPRTPGVSSATAEPVTQTTARPARWAATAQPR
jgi:hypothetical protein